MRSGESYKSPVPPQTFLNMAWVANPMAYLAINTIIATVPTLAVRMHFSRMLAGFICSIWLFARTATFVALRLWPGWHYRFRFLAWSYAVMIASFAGILLAPKAWVLAVAEMFFGVALGLIYYSSLFYSMDVGDTKGEHGGIHEAAIGLGNGTGPGDCGDCADVFSRIPGKRDMRGLCCPAGGLGGDPLDAICEGRGLRICRTEPRTPA